MRPKPLLAPIALAVVTTAFLPLVAGAQIDPSEARFIGPCIAPRGWYAPFAGVVVSFNASADSLLADFPPTWQGRDRIGIALDMREPGMKLKFEPSINVYDYVQGPVQFDPPPPWPSPIDSVTATWSALSPSFAGQNYTNYNNECWFVLGVGGHTMVTADATLNLVGLYASNVDTIKVWGTEFGWPDIQLHDQQPSVVVSVEEGTWGRIKAYLMNGGR